MFQHIEHKTGNGAECKKSLNPYNNVSLKRIKLIKKIDYVQDWKDKTRNSPMKWRLI